VYAHGVSIHVYAHGVSIHVYAHGVSIHVYAHGVSRVCTESVHAYRVGEGYRVG
jgi:hypothetical protein